MYTYFALTGVFNTISSLVLGLVVFLKDKKNRVNISFAIFCLTVAIWSIPYTMWPLAKTAEETLFWFRVLHIGSIFISVVYLDFVSRWLDIFKKNRFVIYVGYFIATFFVLNVFSTNFIADVVTKNVIKFWATPGVLYHYYLVFFFAYALYSSYLLVISLNKSNGVRRSQIKYILIGMLITYAGGSTNYFLWYNIPVLPFGNIFASTYVILTGYAIIKHRLMDIRLVARKYLVYGAYLATVGVFFLITKLITAFFVPKPYEDIVDLVLLIVAVLFTSPIKNYYFHLANKYFFSSLYDSTALIAEISESLQSTIELNKILEDIDETLCKYMHLKAFGVLLYTGKGRIYVVNYNHGFELGKKKSFTSDRYLHKHYTKANLPIVTEELRHENNEQCHKTIAILRELNVEVLVPLNIKDKTIGLLALGKKESGDLYNELDLNTLKVISSQAAVAIENAKLYTEVAQFSETLQSKVDEQTKDIKAQAEHLKKLMDMRSEFLDITSHQLRTPVSVIKGVLSMLEEGSIPQERVPAFIKGAMEKAIKLGEIINDILRASEMDSDKFTMTIRPIDLNKMMDKIKEDKRRTAEMKGLTMIYNIKPMPLVDTDQKYVEHAIVNLINNSLQYTVKGSITVTNEITKSHVIIRVADTGIGIPPEARKKLFQKFSRAQNAVTTFTDGTGLGLFIIKQIVDANPGAKIEIEKTEVDKGTTFAIWLPISKDQPTTK